MKKIFLVFTMILLPIVPLSAAGLKDLDLKSAEISIIGDDSFVTRRAYEYDSKSSTEIFWWRGGYLSWRQLNTNVYFSNMGDKKLWVVEGFNNSKYFSKYVPQNATKQDVKYSNDARQGYYWISQQGKNLSCMRVKGEWGVGAGAVGGDNQITASACKPGPKEKLEAFMHDLMKRVRIDGGTINKLKASGKYEVPASVTPKKSFTNKTAKPADSGSKDEGGTDVKSRLAKLKKLLDAGLITKEEAAEKRKAILDSL